MSAPVSFSLMSPPRGDHARPDGPCWRCGKPAAPITRPAHQPENRVKVHEYYMCPVSEDSECTERARVAAEKAQAAVEDAAPETTEDAAEGRHAKAPAEPGTTRPPTRPRRKGTTRRPAASNAAETAPKTEAPEAAAEAPEGEK